MNFYIVSYDIESDRKRNKVAGILEGYGVRVQYSVFECVISGEECTAMKTRLGKLFEKGKNNDSIRIYKLCKGCVDNIEVIGVKKGNDFEAFKKAIII